MPKAQGIKGKGKSTQAKRLTPREEKLLHLLDKNLESDTPKSMKELLLEAGFSESVAKTQVAREVVKCREKSGMQDALERAGVTRDRIAEKIQEGLEATKPVGALMMPGKGAKDAESTSVDTVDIPDFGVRHKYVDTALKIGGDYASTKVEHSGEAKCIHETDEDMKEFFAWLREKK